MKRATCPFRLARRRKANHMPRGLFKLRGLFEPATLETKAFAPGGYSVSPSQSILRLANRHDEFHGATARIPARQLPTASLVRRARW